MSKPELPDPPVLKPADFAVSTHFAVIPRTASCRDYLRKNARGIWVTPNGVPILLVGADQIDNVTNGLIEHEFKAE